MRLSRQSSSNPLSSSFRAAHFRLPGAPGFQNMPQRAVREGWMETKGLWDGVGFREGPLRDVWEGWMETKGSWDGVGSRHGR